MCWRSGVSLWIPAKTALVPVICVAPCPRAPVPLSRGVSTFPAPRPRLRVPEPLPLCPSGAMRRPCVGGNWGSLDICLYLCLTSIARPVPSFPLLYALSRPPCPRALLSAPRGPCPCSRSNTPGSPSPCVTHGMANLARAPPFPRRAMARPSDGGKGDAYGRSAATFPRASDSCLLFFAGVPHKLRTRRPCRARKQVPCLERLSAPCSRQRRSPGVVKRRPAPAAGFTRMRLVALLRPMSSDV